jgi:hypothetical protein
MSFDDKIFEFISSLGLNTSNYFKISDIHTSHLPNETIQKLIQLNIDAVYLFGSNPTLLFKYDKNTNDSSIYKSLLKSWNFDKAPILFYLTEDNLLIYNSFIFPDKDNLENNIIGTYDDIHKFHINKLTSEEFWENKKETFTNKNRINKRLLQNIVDAKKVLSQRGLKEEYIHSIIGRSLFVRYISDRQLINNNIFNEVEKLFLDKDNLYNSFKIIKENFNGDLFPVTKDEYAAVEQKHLDILYLLFSGGDIITGQPSLFSYYDFSIIPIKLISNIYEKFLHDGENESQAYYTPYSTVELVLSQLMPTNIMQKENIKILDPSCGSGIFLVTFLKKYFENKSGKISPRQILDFIDKSLFGIDIDKDAIQITIFSIYITVLEFFEQPAIQAHDFRFPDLLNKNFFVNDYFNLSKDIILKLGKFDFIIGNPPWGTIKESYPYYSKYCRDNSLPISDKQIAQAFMYKVNDLMTEDTIVSLVISSKILYNAKANEFRSTFLKMFDIKVVIEMSLERKKTFSKAIHPSAVVFYSKKRRSGTENFFTHLTLQPSIFYEIFQIFIFSKEAIKTVEQQEIIANDWMWKALLYGSQFDLEFIKKFKRNYSTLLEFLNTNNSNIGAGCIDTESISKRRTSLPNNVFNDFKMLNTNKSANTFFSHNIDLTNSLKLVDIYEENLFYDRGNIDSYKGPHLLIKRGVTVDGITVGVTEEDCVFKNSVFGISSSNIQILYFLGALYSSKLYNYFLFMISTSWGIERPEVTMNTHKQLPIPKTLFSHEIENLAILYKKLQTLSINEGMSGLFEKNRKEIQDCLQQIDNQVAITFNLNKSEILLIDYALNVFPQISHNKVNKSKPTKLQIEKYIRNFLTFVNIVFDKQLNRYRPMVFQNTNFILIYFKFINDSDDNTIIWTRDNSIQSSNLINSTIKFSLEEITEKISFQRKIFGIDENNFYLIKPSFENQFYPLNAQLDGQSFIEYWIEQDA